MILTIKQAAELLKKGDVVAFPTETVYGLGADATNPVAVQKIFAAKGRPSDNPLIVHLGDVAQIDTVAREISDTARVLMDAFWPGALTVILPKNPTICKEATAGLDTVGVRLPSHPIALALLRETGLPIAAPSANLSGKPSPTIAEHVLEDFTGTIGGVLEGGAASIGLESTVIDCTVNPPCILRPGGVTREMIEDVIGDVTVAQGSVMAPKSPGQKYRHYATRAPLTIVNGDVTLLRQTIREAQGQGKRVGALVDAESMPFVDADIRISAGYRASPDTLARGLFAALRKFDGFPLDVIYAQQFPETGIGAAVMNRLRRAAEGREIC